MSDKEVSFSVEQADRAVAQLREAWQSAGDTDSGRTPLDDLTSMERTFVRDFIATGDIFDAARRAGYSESQALTMIIVVKRPHVRAAIDYIRQTQREMAQQFKINEPIQQTMRLRELEAQLRASNLPWESQIALMRAIREAINAISMTDDARVASDKTVDNTRATRMIEEITKSLRTEIELGELGDVLNAAPATKEG